MVLAMTSCGKEPETTKEEPQTQPDVTVTETQKELGWEGSYQATDTEEHFRIYDVTDTGFKVEFYHYGEASIHKFDYDMEFDNEKKDIASEIGNADDYSGWEYSFTLSGDLIIVSWKQYEQVYTRVS